MKEIQIKLNKYQSRIFKSKKRFLLAVSGIQGGKTFLGAIWLLKEILKDKKSNYLISAPTYKILQQSTLPKFFEVASQLRKFYKKQENVIELPEGGKIFIRSTEDPNKLEGMTLKSAWLDEAGQMKYLVWVNIQGRLAIKQGRLLMTTTPYSLNWLYHDFYQRWKEGDKDIEVVQWRSIDNPYFPKEEYERAKSTLDERVFQRRYNGIFEKMEGLVYADFSVRNIIEKVDAIIEETFAGVDFGFNNPTAIVVIQKDKDGNFYIIDEYYKTGKTQDEINEVCLALQDKYKIQFWYPDPAEPDRIESMKRKGIYCRDVNKDVKAGIDRVKELIRQGRLKVLKHCRHTIDEFETYHYPEEETEEEPVKENDHSMDAVRYAIYTHSPREEVLQDVSLKEFLTIPEDEF